MGDKEFTFNAEALAIARESRGMTMTDLARMVGVHNTMISHVEAGVREPSPELLSRIASVLRYPIRFFQQEERAYGFEPTQLYHRSRTAVLKRDLARIHAQINIIQWNLPKLLRSVELPELRIRRLDIEDFDGTAEDAARAVRASWGLPRGPVRNMTRAVEAAGGLVIPFSFHTEHIDAISMWPVRCPPLFFVDLSKPGDRYRFSLCHELAHVILHRTYLERDMENQANEFAAEFLMPRNEIVFEDVSLAGFAAMKQYWRASMWALIRRAGDLREIDADRKRSLQRKMGALGYRKREPKAVDVAVEQPSLYPGIIELHQREFGYGAGDFGRILNLCEHDVEELYFVNTRNEGERSRLRVLK